MIYAYTLPLNDMRLCCQPTILNLLKYHEQTIRLILDDWLITSHAHTDVRHTGNVMSMIHLTLTSPWLRVKFTTVPQNIMQFMTKCHDDLSGIPLLWYKFPLIHHYTCISIPYCLYQ